MIVAQESLVWTVLQIVYAKHGFDILNPRAREALSYWHYTLVRTVKTIAEVKTSVGAVLARAR